MWNIRLVAFISGVLGVFLLSSVAAADGGYVPEVAYPSMPKIPHQRAIIVYREEARERIIEYYRSLPFIKDVRDSERDPTDIILETFSGRTVRMDIGLPPYFPPTKAQVVAIMDRDCAMLEERLGKGDCFFLFSRGGEISFGQDKAAKDLGLMVEILTSERTAEEKKDLLQRMAILPSGGVTVFDALVTQFKGSPALDVRIERLVQETGVASRRLEDIPSENPFTRSARESRERLLRKEADKESKQP